MHTYVIEVRNLSQTVRRYRIQAQTPLQALQLARDTKPCAWNEWLAIAA